MSLGFIDIIFSDWKWSADGQFAVAQVAKTFEQSTVAQVAKTFEYSLSPKVLATPATRVPKLPLTTVSSKGLLAAVISGFDVVSFEEFVHALARQPRLACSGRNIAIVFFHQGREVGVLGAVDRLLPRNFG